MYYVEVFMCMFVEVVWYQVNGDVVDYVQVVVVVFQMGLQQIVGKVCGVLFLVN